VVVPVNCISLDVIPSAQMTLHPHIPKLRCVKLLRATPELEDKVNVVAFPKLEVGKVNQLSQRPFSVRDYPEVGYFLWSFGT
jgi:hypothetical protein